MEEAAEKSEADVEPEMGAICAPAAGAALEPETAVPAKNVLLPVIRPPIEEPCAFVEPPFC